MSIRNAFEKLDSAMISMVCNDVSLQERLRLAIDEVTLLKEEDFPPDFSSEFGELVEMIGAYQESGNGSDIQSEIALSIMQLFKKLIAQTGMVSR